MPRQTAVVRVLWQDVDGRSVPLDTPIMTSYLKGATPIAEAEFPTDQPADKAGWTDVAGVYRAPSKATRAVIELHLPWAPARPPSQSRTPLPSNSSGVTPASTASSRSRSAWSSGNSIENVVIGGLCSLVANVTDQVDRHVNQVGGGVDAHKAFRVAIAIIHRLGAGRQLTTYCVAFLARAKYSSDPMMPAMNC